MSEILLIDGHSMARRAFHAQQDTRLSTSDGLPTYAVSGFMSMLAKLISASQPKYLGVVFDSPVKTFRHEKLDTYKKQRKPPPQDFIAQLKELKDLLAACEVSVMEVPGVEADDVLASYAELAKQSGQSVEIATGDRDLFQLVADPHVSVLYLSTRTGPEYLLCTEDIVKSKTGVTPEFYVDYATMLGDVSDNLPGVPGIGAKTAAKLVNSFGDIESILAQVDEITPKQAALLNENQDRMRLNKEMMTLVRDLDLPQSVEELEMRSPDLGNLAQKLVDLEFHKLAERIAEAFSLTPEAVLDEMKRRSDILECRVVSLSDSTEAVDFIGSLAKLEEAIGVSVALGKLDEKLPHGTALGKRQVKGMAISPSGAGNRLVGDAETLSGGDQDSSDSSPVWWLDQSIYADDSVKEALRNLFRKCPVRAHGAKDWMRRLLEDEIVVGNLQMDSELASFLLESTGSSSDLRRLLKVHTRKTIPPPEATSGQLQLSDSGKLATEAETATLEALAVNLLYEPLVKKLSLEGMNALFIDMELPLLGVIQKMEHRGIGVDPEELKGLGQELEIQVDKLRSEIHEAAGKEFNVNSPKQLQEILFDDLGLTPTKRTNRGFSTDADSLQNLLGQHPIIELLLDYREVEKLRSTYAEGLTKEVDTESNRIRATFNQMGSTTGRLSSESPNLHNIPVRTDLGKKFRRVFVAEEGSTLVVADYDQIELRCIAHLAQDAALISAFETGQDIHVAVASQVFKVAASDITHEQRNRAKAVSYGLVYGMQAYGLAQRLGLSNSEAQEIIDDYFGAFSQVEGYMKQTIAEARERGYTETLFGRRRHITHLSYDSPSNLRFMAERQAMNSGIQGLAADIFKVALVNIDRELAKHNSGATVVLQVHDEIIFEVPDDEVAEVIELARKVMSSAFEMSVPLVVSIASGKTWADAKL